ncbi:peptidoglycan editing factor PgeF [Candidatus Aerophobetes bacterium]|nr:peptidoglycan editing factor PgeF [Candidatus Aerophobetes bacterium]
MLIHQKNKVIYLTFPHLGKLDCLTHAVSTKLGGVSTGSYKSLNISFNVGDEPGNVLENRRLLCAALGLDSNSVVTGEQVHGTHIQIVTPTSKRGNSVARGNIFPETDVLITKMQGISLQVMIADCPALLFFDPEHHVVALAHAGWQGSLESIAGKAVKAMNQNFHTNPRKLHVGISPSIGPCCYEIGKVVLEKLTACFPGNCNNFLIAKPGGIFHLNLWKLNVYNLLAAQVQPECIEVANICSTCSPELFYSYRKDKGQTGRFGLIASLRS